MLSLTHDAVARLNVLPVMATDPPPNSAPPETFADAPVKVEDVTISVEGKDAAPPLPWGRQREENNRKFQKPFQEDKTYRCSDAVLHARKRPREG